MSWTEEDVAAHYARLKTPPEGANPAPSEHKPCGRCGSKARAWDGLSEPTKWVCGRCRAPLSATEDHRLEAPIQAECCKILEQDGWWILRTDPVSDRRRGTGFGAIGFADITAFRPMRVTQLVLIQKFPQGCPCEVLFLEFKSPKGKPSKEQLKWHQTQRAMGFATFIAGQDFPASTEGFREFYSASGLQRRGAL